MTANSQCVTLTVRDHMTDTPQRTASTNGTLWGARADDWSTIQEGQCSAVYEEVFARLGPGPETVYFDAGCGAGMAVQLAANLGARVSGLDASEELLAIARKRVPQGDFRHGELEQLPFSDASFDLVTGFNSCQYAANPSAALAEARRVAKPRATIVVMTWGEPAGMPAGSPQVITTMVARGFATRRASASAAEGFAAYWQELKPVTRSKEASENGSCSSS